MNRANIKIITDVARNEFNSIINILDNKVKLKELRVFLRLNKLSGFFYSRCRNTEILDKLPVRFREEIIRHYGLQTSFNESLLAEIINLDDILKQNGIEPIFLKGPVFTIKFYGDIGERSISDIDILVENKSDVQIADKVFRDNNYCLKSKPIFGNKLTFLFTHHYEYEKEDFKLDLHWVLQNHFSYNINYIYVWSHKTYFEHNGKNIYTLNNEYELLFRILSIFIDIQLGTIRFRSFVDLYMLISTLYKLTDWERFINDRENENLDNISINILDLLITVFDIRGQYSELDRIIYKNRSKTSLNNDHDKFALLDSTPFSFRNKIWAFKSYNTSFLNALIWWIISVPVKLSIYRSVFLKPIKKLLK